MSTPVEFQRLIPLLNITSELIFDIERQSQANLEPLEKQRFAETIENRLKDIAHFLEGMRSYGRNFDAAADGSTIPDNLLLKQSSVNWTTITVSSTMHIQIVANA